MTKHTHLLAALLASLPAALTAPLAAQNHPPAAPTITEPSTPNRILNPNDVHMETAPFVDPDAGDQHAATDWEIWTVTPNQRVWVAANLTGVERVHTHLGDGIFENSHGGWNRLFASTQYTLRVRHKDDSGDPATEWSPWTATAFATGAAEVKSPLLLDDAADNPPPTWTDGNGVAIDLPTGTPNPVLRLETDSRWLLLRLDGDPATGNRVTNPGALPLHRAVRVVIDAGNTGSVLSLPATDLTVHASNCERHVIRLPAVTLAPFQSRAFWVGEHGTTYDAVPTAYVPNFSTLARGLDVPWIARRPGFVGLSFPTIAGFAANGAMPHYRATDAAHAEIAGDMALDALAFERGLLVQLPRQRRDTSLHRSAVLGLGRLVQVLLVGLDGALRVPLPFVGARQVVQDRRVRLDGVRLPQERDGFREAPGFVVRRALLHQLHHPRALLLAGRRQGRRDRQGKRDS